MKKRKILLLIPFAGLVLSGCSVQDGFSWIGKNIFEPIGNWISSIFNPGGKKGEGGGGGGEDKPAKIETGTLENPLSVYDFRTQVDRLIDYDQVSEGESLTDTEHLFYVRAEVISSSEMNQYGEIQYLNLKDIVYETIEITGHYTLVDESVEGDYSAANSLAGKFVTVKGYACLYHHASRGKTYQLAKADNDNKPTVMVVEDKEILGIDSVTGPEEVVKGTTIPKSNVSVVVSYVTGGKGAGEILSVVAPTDELGEYDAVVRIKGWDADLSFHYTVIDILPGDTKTFSAQDLIDKPDEYEGGSVKLESHQVNPVLTVAVEASDANSGKIYKDSTNGFQIRLYKSGTGKFVASVVPGYVITSATAVSAPKGSNWYVAGVETEMTISSTKRRASIGGSEDRVVYSATITYALDVEVESVEIEESEVSLEMGKAGQQLHVNVLPELAADRSVTWESKDTSKVLVSEEGFVSPVAITEEPVEVVATSVANPDASDSCLVSVVEATATIDHIEITGEAEKTEYVSGEAFDHSGLGVEIYYSDETHEPAVSDIEWSADPEAAEVGVDEVIFSAEYQGHSATLPVSVSVSEAKGTADHPYTVAEARAAIDAGEGISEVYATGIVSEIVTPFSDAYSNITFNISSDGSKTADQLQGYRTKVSSADDVAVGDLVVLYGNLKKYNSTYEFDAGNTIYSRVTPTVDSVAISGTPSQTSYGVGQNYSHAGLVATAHLSNGLDIDVSSSATWEPSKATAEDGDTEVSFIAIYEGVPSEAFSFTVSVSGTAVLVETEIYKLDGTITGGTNGYAEASAISQNGLDWSVTANTTMSPWRFGGKGAQVRTCESTSAVASDDITKVVVNTGTTNATVNSITLKVGTSQGASDVSEITVTSGLISAALEFARPEGTSWASRYFTVVFDVTCSTSSNQYVQLNSIQFYAMR